LSRLYNSGTITKSSAIKVLNSIECHDKKFDDWRKYLGGTQKVISIEDCKCDSLYDLTIDGAGTYMASTNGSPCIIHNTGFSFSKLRPANDIVGSTRGISSGPISFMSVFNAATEVVKQGSKRRGANMAALSIHHPDIRKFIVCKRDLTKLNNFNISVLITDEFMNAVRNGDEYPLINPHTNAVTMDDAEEVFELIVDNAWETGEPGVIFIDEINRHNPAPQYGEIRAVNPCAEAHLLDNESCILGSIDVSKMITRNQIDWDKLKDTTCIAVRFLDNIIDINSYPLPEIEKATKLTRKIGLGIMGFADMLIHMRIKYSSEKAINMAEALMKFINDCAEAESRKLAEEKGEWADGVGIRNATRTTIAPTGTISMIAGCSSGIEPIYASKYQRIINDKKVNIEHPLYTHMKNVMDKRELDTLFETAYDIPFRHHVAIQAAFQKYVDQGISKTINFVESATKDDIRNAYLLADSMKLKGLTVYRNKSRENQVLSIKSDNSVAVIHPRERPEIVNGQTHKIATGCGNLYVTINEDNLGLCEVFCAMGRSGGCTDSQSEAISRLISLLLRCGISVGDIIKQLRGIRCPNPVWSNGELVLSCADAVCKALSKYVIENGDGKYKTPGDTEMTGICPNCGNVMTRNEGCASCKICGYSKC